MRGLTGLRQARWLGVWSPRIIRGLSVRGLTGFVSRTETGHSGDTHAFTAETILGNRLSDERSPRPAHTHNRDGKEPCLWRWRREPHMLSQFLR